MGKQVLHTVHLTGGTDFSIRFKGNPALTHDGSVTVGHFVLTEEEADTLRGFALIHGCVKREVFPMQGQTEEQARIRQQRLGILPGFEEEDGRYPLTTGKKEA